MGNTTSATTCHFPPDVPATTLSTVLRPRGSLKKSALGSHTHFQEVTPPPNGPLRYYHLARLVSTLAGSADSNWFNLTKPNEWIIDETFPMIQKYAGKQNKTNPPDSFPSPSNAKSQGFWASTSVSFGSIRCRMWPEGAYVASLETM